MPSPAQGSAQALQFIAWSVKPAVPFKDAKFFFGPKDFDVLHNVTPDLVRAIDFGMFDWLVVPLLRALKWVNGYVGNYGWSIIALTMLINLAIFPLRHKSVVSMRKMQEIQPQMKAIQDRYAKLKVTDPARQKMNEEVMALYREAGSTRRRAACRCCSRCRCCSPSTPCSRWRSSCAARRSSAGSGISRRTTRGSSRRC